MNYINTIRGQLGTIKVVAHQGQQMLDSSDEVDIIPTLDSIRVVLDYLYSIAPDWEAPEVDAEPFKYDIGVCEGTVTIEDNVDSSVINIEAIQVDPSIDSTDLFGENPPDAIEVILNIPIICGNAYRVVQSNNMLSYFADDPSITQEDDGTWVKDKTYQIDDEDVLVYSFLVGPGRKTATIEISGPDMKHTFFINSHVHFNK